VNQLLVFLRGAGTEADLRRTLNALQANTADLEVCLLDAQDDRRALLDRVSASGRLCVVGEQRTGWGVDEPLVWAILAEGPQADLVLLEVGTVVGRGWEKEMRAAAYGDAVIATSSAVPTAMLTLKNQPGGLLPEATPDSVRGPGIGQPLRGCVYIRRDAVKTAMKGRRDHVGGSAESRTPLEQIVLAPGLVHVLASTVVMPAGRSTVKGAPLVTPTLRRALLKIEAAAEPLRVLVDMRCCMYPVSGTQVHALNLVSQLATRNDVDVSILMPVRPHDSVRSRLEALPLTMVRYEEGQPIDPPPHVFHRPYQVFEGHISDLVMPGVRLVITHQDFILDRTPSYFRSEERWRNYAAATALSLVAADEVVFYSEHARQEAVGDGLLDRSKTSVVPPGTNHIRADPVEERPSRLNHLVTSAESKFLLFIGNDYMHKNRFFAVRVAEELTRVYSWDGTLVCVGGRPTRGASLEDGNAFRGQRKGRSPRFVDLGRVTDAELWWLYRHASVVLFPSLYEGFGLIPFESAAAGTPCVYGDRSSIGEYLPSEGALLDLGDVAETARRLQRVLRDGDLSNSIVRATRLAGSSLTWSRTAESYVQIYYRALARPVGLSLALGDAISVGARSEMASTEAERRILLALKRNAAVRRLADRALTVALAARGATRRR
jgi:glycosyltransferase involved in cell wall biosynthesis